MGIIVGFLALAIATGALLLAWALSRIIGGYRKAALILAALLAVAAFGVFGLYPVSSQRPETFIWPMALAGSAGFIVLVLFYAFLFSIARRGIRRLLGRAERS